MSNQIIFFSPFSFFFFRKKRRDGGYETHALPTEPISLGSFFFSLEFHYYVFFYPSGCLPCDAKWVLCSDMTIHSTRWD